MDVNLPNKPQPPQKVITFDIGERMRRFVQVYAVSLATAALVIIAAAVAHKSGITSRDYEHSPLIAVQIFGVLALFITMPSSILMAIVVALQKKWKEVLCLGACYFLMAPFTSRRSSIPRRWFT